MGEHKGLQQVPRTDRVQTEGLKVGAVGDGSHAHRLQMRENGGLIPGSFPLYRRKL